MKFFPLGETASIVGQGLIFIDDSPSPSVIHTKHSVRLIRTSDKPDEETPTCTTNSIHKRRTSMSPVRFELTIPASERPKTHALDRAATGVDE
jgi:hypothetical protein